MSNGKIYRPEDVYTPTRNVRFVPVFKPKYTPPFMPADQTEREDRVWDFLIGKLSIQGITVSGLNSYAVAGIMGNLFVESGMQSIRVNKNWRDGSQNTEKYTDAEYTRAADTSGYTCKINGQDVKFADDKAAYGLAQWFNASRKQNLLNFAKGKGISVGDFDTQLLFMWEELRTDYGSVYEFLKTVENVHDAARKFYDNYEMPGASDPTFDRREAASNTYLRHYAPGSVSDSPTVSITYPQDGMTVYSDDYKLLEPNNLTVTLNVSPSNAELYWALSDLTENSTPYYNQPFTGGQFTINKGNFIVGRGYRVSVYSRNSSYTNPLDKSEFEVFSMLSGMHWCKRFPEPEGETAKLNVLDDSFKNKAIAFIRSLRNEGFGVEVSSTRRPSERAYLMHYAWMIYMENMDANTIPKMEGVDVIWSHNNTRTAAKDMCDTYKLIARPSLNTNHTPGRAMDITLTPGTTGYPLDAVDENERLKQLMKIYEAAAEIALISYPLNGNADFGTAYIYAVYNVQQHCFFVGGGYGSVKPRFPVLVFLAQGFLVLRFLV